LAALLRLPPLLALVIILAVMAFVVYHIVTVRAVQPLAAIGLALCAIGLVRTVFRMRRKMPDGTEGE